MKLPRLLFLILILSSTRLPAQTAAQAAGEWQAQKSSAEAATAAAVVAAAAATSAATVAASSAASAAAAAAAGRSQNTALMITQTFGFLAVLAGFLFQAFTSARDRRWARQDAEKKQDETKAHRVVLLDKIAEVKEEANKSYQEANNVNLKLERLGVRIAEGQDK